jgi:MFS family permease
MLSSTSRPSKTLTLLAVCLGTFMLIIDVQIVVVALPSIRTALHTSFSDEQWTIDAYSLSLAALLLLTGSLGDILGRRRVFALGLAAFTAGSLLCGVAGSARNSSSSARFKASAGPRCSPPHWHCSPRPSRAVGSASPSASGVPSSLWAWAAGRCSAACSPRCRGA